MLGERKVLGECLRDQEREDERGLAIDLHRARVQTNLGPREGLVGLGARVRAIERLTGVDKHAKVDSVAHAVRIQDVMLGRGAAQNDRARVHREQAHQVHALDVLDQVELEARVRERMKEQGVADGSVGHGRTKHRNVVLVAPVVDRLFIVDLLAHALDELRRRPVGALLPLLNQALVQDLQQPRLEQTVVVVRHEHVADAVEAVLARLHSVVLVVAQVGRLHALHKVLLDAASGCHDTIDHVVLDQVEDALAHTARDHVRRVAEKDGAVGALHARVVRVLREHVLVEVLEGARGGRHVRVLEIDGRELARDHLVDLLDGLREARRLEARGAERLEDLLVVEARSQL